MLLIDGVRYELWTPPSEDEFERVVEKHAEEVFGKDAKYFDLKHRLASRSGTGSIPDGYVITLGDKPKVQVVELELASHSLQHIVSQIVNIINGIENSYTQQKICNAIEDGINEDDIFATKVAKAIKPVAIHRFLSDSFSNTLPIINIIIDQSWPALDEAVSKISPPPKIIEFQTFAREGVGLSVHAHLFEPLYQPRNKIPGGEIIIAGTTIKPDVTKRVTIKDLMDSGIVKSGQTIYGWHKGKKYEAIILFTGEIELAHTHDGSVYNSPSAAGKRILGHEIDGWTWWRTTGANGEECLLDELRKEYRATHPNNS
jgi:hypothetical protein